MVKGNIYVGYQPLRATLDKAEMPTTISPIMMSTHQYLEFYRWLRDVFRADAVIHMGAARHIGIGSLARTWGFLRNAAPISFWMRCPTYTHMSSTILAREFRLNADPRPL